FAALVPPAHGGLGLDPATWTMVIEEVARAWAAPALLAVAQGGVAWALGLAGGDTARHLPALGRADTLAAVVPVPAPLARRAVVELGLGAVAVGVGQAAFEAALRYAQQRTTFGKAICQHQAEQLKLADMATRLTAARLLVGEAATHDAAAARRARRFAVDAAVDVTLESMRIHGGYGYTTEFPV